MIKLVIYNRNRALFYMCLLFLVTSNIGCSTYSQTTDTFRDNTHCSLSRTKGQTHKYFSSRIIVNSNFIKDLEIVKVEGLPPGITLNRSRNVLEGTCNKAGFYNIKVWFKDKYKGYYDGTVSKPTWSYYKHFEISIYDKLN